MVKFKRLSRKERKEKQSKVKYSYILITKMIVMASSGKKKPVKNKAGFALKVPIKTKRPNHAKKKG